MIVKRQRLRWLAGGAVALLGTAILWVRPDLAVQAGAGLAAHGICSAVFVSGQDAKKTFDELVMTLGGPVAHAITFQVDQRGHFVKAQFAGIWQARAAYVPGYRCRLEQPNSVAMPDPIDLESVRSEPAPPILATNPTIRAAIDAVFAESGGKPPKACDGCRGSA